MLWRLSCMQTGNATFWKPLLKGQTQSLKILSSNLIRISTCPSNFTPFKPKEVQQADSNVVKYAITSFKGNPYVRLMRLDRPIGERKISCVQNIFLKTPDFRLLASILALQLVHSTQRSSWLSTRSLYDGFIRRRCNNNARCWMHDKRHVGQGHRR